MIELGELNSHAYFSFHKKGSLHQSLQQQEVASMQTIKNNLAISRAHGANSERRRSSQYDDWNIGDANHSFEDLKRDLKIYSDFCDNVLQMVTMKSQHIIFQNKLMRQVKPHSKKVQTPSPKKRRRSTIFHPLNEWKIRWDFLMGIVIIYSVMQIPFRFGWTSQVSADAMVLDYIIDGIFVMDMFINVNTAFFDVSTEKYIFNRKKIALKYCEFWFWVDLISAVPFEVVLGVSVPGHINFIHLVKLLRLIRLARVFKLYRNSTLNDYLEAFKISPSLINLLLIVMQIFFICHVFACFWHFLTLDNDQSWVTEIDLGIDATSIFDTYVASLYFIVVTMLTVGYGDIHATNNDERAFAIATMLTGGILFGALLSKVTLLIDKRDPQAKAYKEKMSELRSYLDGVPLSLELKNEAKDAYSYFLHKKSSFGEASILNNLPQPALVKLVTQIYAKEIDRIKVFKTFDKVFVIELIKHMRPFQARKGEELFSEGDVLNDIVFISIGDVLISKFNGMHQVLLGSCQEGGYFGDFEYHKNTTSVASYRAASNCNLLAVAHNVINRASSMYLDAGKEFKLQVTQRYKLFFKVVDMTMGSNMKTGISRVDSKYVDKVETECVTEDGLEEKQIYIDGELQPLEKVNLSSNNNRRRNQGNTYRVLASNVGGSAVITEMEKSALTEAFIIHPDDYRKGYWDIFVGVLIIISVLIAPVDVAFSTNSLSDTADFTINVVFMMDILVTFRTAFESKVENAFVISPKHIAKRYFKTWFLIDAASSIPLSGIVNEMYVKNSLFKILRLSRLLRVTRMFKLKVYLSRFESLSGISPNVFDMLTLIIKVTSIGHIIACVWWGLSTLLSTNGTSWYENGTLNGLSLQKESTSVQYIYSLYWTIATLTTVGYGDVVATNSSERILNIFILLIGASVFGFIIANVSSILDNIDRKGTVTIDKITQITEYLRHKNCPPAIADSIINHFRQVYSLQSTHDGMDLLTDLPTNVKNKILLIQFRAKLEKIAIFRHVPNKSVCLYLFEMMNPIFYQPGHVIMSEGEKGEEILFLVSGEGVAMTRIRPSAVPFPVSNDKRRSSVLKSPLGAFRESQDEDDFDFESNKEDNTAIRSSPSDLRRNRFSAKKRRSLIAGSENITNSKASASESQKNAFTNGRRPAMVGGDHTKDFLPASFRDSGNNMTNYLIDAFTIDEMETEKEEEKADVFDDVNTWAHDEYEMKRRGFSKVGKLQPGHFFGHVALLDQSTHRVSVVATSPACVYSLSKLAMNQMIKIEPTVAMIFQNALSLAIRKQEKKLGHLHAKEKNTSFLAKIKKKYFKVRGLDLNNSIIYRIRRSSTMVMNGEKILASKYGLSAKVKPMTVPIETLHPDLRESFKRRESSKGKDWHSETSLSQSVRRVNLDAITSRLNQDSDSDDSAKFPLATRKSFKIPVKKRSIRNFTFKPNHRHSPLTKVLKKFSHSKYKRVLSSGEASLEASQSILLHRRWSMSDVLTGGGGSSHGRGGSSPIALKRKTKVGTFLGEWSIPSPSNSRHSRGDEKSSEMVTDFVPLPSDPKTTAVVARLRRQSFPSLENAQWELSKVDFGLT